MIKKKSQLSVEFLVIFGVLIILITTFIIINFEESFVQQDKNSKSKIDFAISEISSSAKKVYYQGEGAKEKILISLPNNIQGQYIGSNSLVYNISGISGSNQTITRKLDINITGNLPITTGYVWVTIESFGGYVYVS